MSGFTGFPPGLFAFYAELEQDNSREFWTDHKERWQRDVRDPLLALLDALAPEFGPLRMFRPHRDVRFAKDKSPFKLWAGATSESRAVGGIGYYLEVSAAHLVTGYGAMALAPDQLQRFRAAIAASTSGQAFESLHDTLATRDLPLSPGIDPPLKLMPRGFAPDHPRAVFLRWKGAAVVREWEAAAWMRTPQVLDTVRGVWRGAAPLKEWLATYVGPSDRPAR